MIAFALQSQRCCYVQVRGGLLPARSLCADAQCFAGAQCKPGNHQQGHLSSKLHGGKKCSAGWTSARLVSLIPVRSLFAPLIALTGCDLQAGVVTYTCSLLWALLQVNDLSDHSVMRGRSLLQDCHPCYHEEEGPTTGFGGCPSAWRSSDTSR